LESSGEEGRINISHRRGKGGRERKAATGGGVIVMFVSVIPSPGNHEGAAKNVARSSATEIATIAHKRCVDKQSAT